MVTAVKHSDSTKGIVAMVVAALLFTLNDATSKYLTESFSIWQVLAVRQFFSLLVIVAYIHMVTGWVSLRVSNGPGMAIRAFFFVATTALIVASIAVLPLAFVTAIAFSSPIFAVAFSHWLGSENVGARRWTAVVAGFVGVLVVVRPGGAEFDWVVLLPVAAALTATFRDLVTRPLSKTDSSISILLWSNIAVIVVAWSATFLSGFDEIDATSFALLALNGLLNAGAHFLIIESFRLGEVSLVAPFRYSALVWATILGLLIWGDVPDWWTIAGAVLLVASGIYIIERSPGGRSN